MHHILTGDGNRGSMSTKTEKSQKLPQNDKPVPIPKQTLHIQKPMPCICWKFKNVIQYDVLEYETIITWCSLSANWLVKSSIMSKASFFGKPKMFYFLTWQYNATGCKTQQRKIRSFVGEVLLHPPYSLDKLSADFLFLR